MYTGNLQKLPWLAKRPSIRVRIGGNHHWAIALPYSGAAAEEFTTYAHRLTRWEAIAALSGRLIHQPTQKPKMRQ